VKGSDQLFRTVLVQELEQGAAVSGQTLRIREGENREQASGRPLFKGGCWGLRENGLVEWEP
jgi:hypothetical protein